ncbi:MAG: zinc ribbon domain-containing protein [Phycisphaerae bacterium]
MTFINWGREAASADCWQKRGDLVFLAPLSHFGPKNRIILQITLGVKRYQGHDLTCAGSLVRCGHCGAVITGESATKKKTGREYVYYRCSKYTAPGHPRIRLTERALDAQVLALFDRIRLPDDLSHWFQ